MKEPLTIRNKQLAAEIDQVVADITACRVSWSDVAVKYGVCANSVRRIVKKTVTAEQWTKIAADGYIRAGIAKRGSRYSPKEKTHKPTPHYRSGQILQAAADEVFSDRAKREIAIARTAIRAIADIIKDG